MYNLRYHVASLVSVFLALALGLILGGLVVDKTSTLGQSAIVNGIKQEFASIRKENTQLNADLGTYQEFASDLGAQAIKGTLSGKTIGVIGLDVKADDSARKAIVAAGGTSVQITLSAVKYDKKNSSSKVNQLLAPIMTAEGTSDPYTAIGATLAKEWVLGGKTDKPLTKALVDEGVLTIDNIDSFNGVAGIIDTAIDGKTVDELGMAIAGAFNKASYPTICASTFHGNDILAEAGWKQKISSTNMLGSSIGIYTIASLNNGASAGLYGTPAGAKSLYPQFKTIEPTTAKTTTK